jgi:hypothetical protein
MLKQNLVKPAIILKRKENSMTDKVHKIREEVIRLQNELIQEKEKGFGSDIDDACILELQNVLTYIDSLQKEPVSEKKCMFTKDSYTDDDRKVLCKDCDEKCEYSKKEEPVSEPNKELAETYLAVFDKKFPVLPTLKGKQLADYKNFLNKCQQIFGLKEWGIHPIQSKLFEKLSLLWAAWGAEHLQGVGRQDEKEQDIPVSEELEEAAADYEEEKWKAGHPEDTYNSSDIIKAVKYGAKWQKEKDNEKKVLTYKHGFEDCKEQMMGNTIDAQCFGFQGAALFSFRLPADNYLVGSEVKVIVIKED